MKWRHILNMVGLATAIVAPVLGPSHVAEAAVRPYPVRRIPVTGVSLFAGIRPAMERADYVMVLDVADAARLEVATGETTPIAFAGFSAMSSGNTLAADGKYGYAVNDKQIKRVTIDGGASVVFTVPFTGDWSLTRVADTDASGRYLLLQASSGGFGSLRVFLYDTQTRQLVTPEPDGVEAATNVEPIWISDDGQQVRYATYFVGGSYDGITTWDRSSGRRTTLGPPKDHDAAAGQWTASPDLGWVVFPGSKAGIVPGLDATTRLYRRDLTTGITSVVPLEMATVDAYAVGNGGRVLTVADGAVAGGGTMPQIYTWDGSGPALMVSRSPGGAAADSGVEQSPLPIGDSTLERILFTSFSTNMVPGETTVTRRLFEATLPAVGSVNAGAAVGPRERYCVTAAGAEPGDFVGVNITPVGAGAPGFGTLHSSDDPPGPTSNVNFGAGTVDPNVAFAEVGADGRICFTNSMHGPVHLILDEMIVADSDAFRPPTADGSTRLVDTRVGLGGTTVAASETRCVRAAGASAGEFVGVNVLPLDARSPGFGTLHPSGSAPGPSSTANFGPGSVDPNFAFTQVGADGRICFTNSVHGPVELVLDELIVGTADAMSRPTGGSSSDRPVDTRKSPGTPLAPGGTVCFTVGGAVAGDFGGVNLLAVEASGPGYATLHSSAEAPGTTSNINFAPGSVDPNFGIAAFGSDRSLCLTNSRNSSAHVVIDSQVIAKANVFSKPSVAGTVRLVDTRVGRA